MFAHLSHENEDFKTCKTVTGFFKYMIKCFHNHMKKKMEEKNVQMHYLYEEDHRELDKVAFESLSKEGGKIVWKAQELSRRLGKDFYDQYLRTGILVEEEILHSGDLHGFSPEKNEREVRFYHKLFCEWYAAHHLAKCATWMQPHQLQDVLKNMDPFDLQYCYRFACGIGSSAAVNIIQYVKRRNGGDKFAILCLLEKGVALDNILETVEELCEKKFEFEMSQGNLVLRSTVQLLEIASSNGISIPGLTLKGCFSKMDLSSGVHIKLNSGLCIPVLTTLVELKIWEEGKQIREEDMTSILKYASMCPKLEKLEFTFCLLPQYIKSDCLSDLGKRDVDVCWHPYISSPNYEINFKTENWQRTADEGGLEMTDEDYKREEERVALL